MLFISAILAPDKCTVTARLRTMGVSHESQFQTYHRVLNHEGAYLGAVGGRMLTEVLLSLLLADPTPYLHADPGWQPTLPAANDILWPGDLLTVAGVASIELRTENRPAIFTRQLRCAWCLTRKETKRIFNAPMSTHLLAKRHQRPSRYAPFPFRLASRTLPNTSRPIW